MVNLRLVVLAAAFALPALPAAAGDMSGLAPADEYFGRYRLSVLGIANTIRDAGSRLDEGRAPQAIVDGPLAFASDAIRAWEAKYPNDPWIPRDLLALEVAYVHAGTPYGMDLARRTEAWIAQDYPGAARDARLALHDGRGDGDGGAWERFAAMRAPFPH